MGALIKTAIGFGVLIITLLVVGWFLPSNFEVQRQITINATPEKVFPHVVNLKQWRNWGVWFERDPNMQVIYSGKESQVGMKSSWVSEQEGSGEMTITKIQPLQQVEYNLYFPELDMGSTGELTLVPIGNTTQVTWRSYGDVGGNPVDSFFAAFMDSLIGPDFETGLVNLKKQVEKP